MSLSIISLTYDTMDIVSNDDFNNIRNFWDVFCRFVYRYLTENDHQVINHITETLVIADHKTEYFNVDAKLTITEFMNTYIDNIARCIMLSDNLHDVNLLHTNIIRWSKIDNNYKSFQSEITQILKSLRMYSTKEKATLSEMRNVIQKYLTDPNKTNVKNIIQYCIKYNAVGLLTSMKHHILPFLPARFKKSKGIALLNLIKSYNLFEE